MQIDMSLAWGVWVLREGEEALPVEMPPVISPGFTPFIAILH
jgi:hypothetical protein